MRTTGRALALALVLQSVVLPTLGGVSLTLPGTGQLFRVSSLLDGAKLNTATRAALAATGTNKTINFQGKVVNSNGLNVANGSYNFSFKIYTVATGGTAVWTESKSLTVNDGIFQTNLGDATSLPASVDFNTDNIYLGITFNSDGEMTPRIQFTSAAYAFNADKLDGLDSTQFARTDANNTLTGTQTINVDSTGALAIQNAAGNQTLLNFSTTGATAGALTVGSTTTKGSLVVTAGNGFSATVSPTALTANRTLTLPDADGTLCTTATCTAGTAANFIQNQSATAQSANFWIQSASTGVVGAIIQGISGQATDIFQVATSASTGSSAPFRVANTGQTTINNSATAGNFLYVKGNSVFDSINTNIAVTIKNRSINSSDSLQTTNGNDIVLSGINSGGGFYANGSASTLGGLTYPSSITSSVAGTSNYYRVSSLNSQGETTASPEVSGGAATTLSWTAVAGATSYRVYRGTASGAQTGYFTVTAPTASQANADTTTLTTASLPSGNTFGPVLTVKSGNNTANIFEVYGNNSGGAQTLRVYADNTGTLRTNAAAAFSNSQFNSISAIGATNSIGTTVAAYIQGATNQTADILQNRASGGAVLSGTNANGGFFTNGTNNTFGSLAVPTGVTDNTTGTNFYYKVTAVNGAGETIGSSEVSGSAAATTVSWNAVAGATSYRVYRGTSSNGQTGYNEVTGTSLANAQSATLTTATVPTAPVGTGLTVQLWNGQTGNALTVQNSTGTTAARITGTGDFIGSVGIFGSSACLNTCAQINAVPRSTTSVGINVQGRASQTADLLQFQDSSNNVLTNFTANGYLNVNRATAATDNIFTARVAGDTNDRITIGADGKLNFGSGSAASDSNLYRSSASTLTADGNIKVISRLGVGGIALNAKFNVGSPDATTVGTVIRGAASQTADLLQLQNVGSSVLGGFNASGQVFMQSGSYTGTLAQATLGSNQTYTFPDATGIVCLSTNNCGYATAGGSYINNGTTVQSGNFYIQSAAAGNIGAIVQGASGQTADIFRITDSANANLLKVAANGTISGANGGFTLTATGFLGLNDASGAAKLGVASNSVVANFNATSTQNIAQFQNNGTTVVTIGNNGALSVSPNAAATGLTVTGNASQGSTDIAKILTNGGNGFRIDANGEAVESQRLSVGGSNVANTLNAKFGIQPGAATTVGQIIQAYSGQTADLFRNYASDGTTVLSSFNASGQLGINTTAANPLAINTVTTSTTGTQASQLLIGTNGTNNNGITIQGVASQSATSFALRVDNSNGNVIAGIYGNGDVLTYNTVKTFDQAGAGNSSGALTLRSGNATGTTANSGNVAIDAGTATGTTGTVSIAGTNASALNLGRAALVTNIQGGASISSGQAGTVALSASAVSGQSVDIFRVVSSGGTTVLKVGNNGAATVQGAVAGANVITVKGAASQSGDLLQLQASGSTASLGGFNASGQLYTQSGSFTGTFVQGTLSASQQYTLPDATGTVCLSTNNCGYLSAAGSYINNSTNLQTAANFNIQTGNVANVTAAFQAIASQTANLLELRSSGGGTLSNFDASANLNVRSASGASFVYVRRSDNGAAGVTISVDPSAKIYSQGTLSLAAVGSGSVTVGSLAGAAMATSAARLVVTNDAGQTGDSISNRDANGNSLSGFNNNGALYTNGTANTMSGLSYPTGVTSSVTGTANYYRVSSLNSQGETIASSEISGGTGTTISWTAAAGATSYRVYRGTASGAQTGYFTVTAPTVSQANADTQTLTTASLPTGANFGAVLTVNAANGSNATPQFVINNGSGQAVLSAGINGSQNQTAINGSLALTNNLSNLNSALKVTNNLGTTVAAYIQGASSQTADLFQNRSSNGAVLSGVTGNGTYYSNGTGQTVGNLAVPVISTTGTGTTSYFVVTALNAAGTSTVASNEVGTDGSAGITWAPVAGAVSYNVYRGTTAGGENNYKNLDASSCTSSACTTGQTGYSLSGTAPITTGGTALNLNAWAGQNGNILSVTNASGGSIGGIVLNNGGTNSIFRAGTFQGTSSGDAFLSMSGGGAATFVSNLATRVGLVSKGVTSQSADLLQLQDVNANVLTSFTSNGYLAINRAVSANDRIFTGRVAGDTNDRIQISANGQLSFGSGSGASDTLLYRGTTAGQLVLNNALSVNTATKLAQLSVLANNNTKGIVVQANTAQSSDLFQLQDNSNNPLSGFNATGQFYNANSGFTGTIAQSTLSANQTYTFPNATGTVCLSTNNCGYSNGSYINNSVSQQTANMNIVSAATGSIAAVIQGASGGTADVLSVNDGTGAAGFRVDSAGRTYSTNSSFFTGNIVGLGNSTPIRNSGNTGTSLFFKPSSDANNPGAAFFQLNETGSQGVVIQTMTGNTGTPFRLQDGNGSQTAAIDGSGGFVTKIGLRSSNTSAASSNTNGINIVSGNATGATSYSGNVTVDAGTGTSGGGNVYLGNANAGSVNVGRAGATTTIQGSSASTTVITSGSFTNTVAYAAPTANVTTTFPAAGGTVCTNVASTCSTTYQAAGNYIAKNAIDSTSASASGTGGILTIANTNTTGQVLILQNAGNNSTLSVTGSQNATTGAALIKVNQTAASPAGNLIDLQTGGTSKFAVDVNGATTSGTINGQTISSAASFTGTVTSASTVSVTSGGIAVTGASSIAGKLTVSTGGADITGNVAVTGAVSSTGDITLDRTGSTTTNPRTLGFTGNASGNAARISLSDGNGMQLSNGGAIQLYSFNGIQIAGGRQASTAPSFATGTASDPSLTVIGTTAASHVMIVQGAASQSGDLLRLTNSSNGLLAKFDANGALSAPGVSSVNGYQINGAATSGTYLRGNGSAYVSSAIQAADIPSGSVYYIAKNAADSSSASVVGNLLSLTNNTGAAGGVLALSNSGTNSALSVSAGANPGSGQALILANNTAGTPTGNLIDLQAAGTSKFAVAASGNVTGGTVNGQTISSAANFTGTVATANTLTVNAGGITVAAGGINVTGVATFNSGANVAAGGLTVTAGGLNVNSTGVTNAGAISGATGLTFTGNSAIDTAGANTLSIGTTNATGVTVGRTGGSLALQGSAATTLKATNGANTTTVAFTSPTANVTYNFGTVTAGTYQICSTFASTCGSTYASYYANGYVQLAPGSAQADATTNTSLFINKTAGTSLVNLQASGSSVFTVQTNGDMASTGGASLGSNLLTVDTVNFRVKVGTGTPTLTAAANTASGQLFVSGTAEFAGQIRIGDATNNVNVDATTKEITLAGTARHTKKITLKAEYAGAILDTGGQTATTGTMTASFDAAARMSYYRWLSGQSTANTYDVLVQVPVPDDWSGWAGNPSFSTYATGTSGTTLQTGQSVTIVGLTRTDGTADTAFNSLSISPSALNTWTTSSGTAMNASGYAAGGTMTLRIRLSALITNAAAVQLGDITFPYYSKY